MDDKMKKLLKQNELYKKILKSLPDLFAYKNIEGVYEVVSKEVDRLYEDKFDTIEGKSIYDIYSEEALKDVLSLDQEVIDNKGSVSSVFDAETSKGLITLDSTRTPVYDDDGKLQGIFSMSKDIGEVVKINERLESITRIQDVIISITKSFVDVNSSNFDEIINNSLLELGNIIDADRAYIYEYNFSENTMDNTHEWVADGYQAEIENLQGIPITYYLDGWVNIHREKKIKQIIDMEDESKDSNLYKLLKPQGIKSLITIPIFIDNECSGFLGFDAMKENKEWKDVVELFNILPEMYASVIKQQRTLKALENAQKEAEVATSVQSDFIAKVTHELRTPINGLSNALYLIQESPLTIDQHQYTEIMEYSLEVLSSMVNNILDYSKIEKDKLINKPSDVNLENEIIKIIKVNKYMANNKGLGLYLNYDYSIPTIVSVDMEKLRQVLNNLIVNAIKYTNYGHVEVKVTAVTNESPYCDIRFEVIDTGIGISDYDQAHIFDEFYQVGDKLNKMPQGTGLGLTITREFLSFLKSELRVESKTHEGSNFNFDLKFYSPNSEPIQQFNKKVLLVDLSENVHSNIIDFLNAHFATVDTCNVRNCRLAIRAPYDTVFVYTNDTKSFPSKISKISNAITKAGNRMKKVLLYDTVKNQELLNYFELFDCTVELPTSTESFLDIMSGCGKVEVVDDVLESTPTEKRHKILLVDDNNINRRVMGELLKGMYIDVTEAKDGFEAVELAQKDTYNMIFMDILMPGMDGYETSRKIREIEGVRGSIPIIAVTANDAESTKDKIIEYGMNGVLSKPLKKDDLEKLLSEYFSNIVNAVDNAEENYPIFDKDEFELFYEEDFLRIEILDTFLGDTASDLNRITEAYSSKDCKKIHKALHYMKGSFTYLKATKILKITQQILDLTDQDKLNEVLMLREPLLKNYDLLQKELKKYKDTV